MIQPILRPVVKTRRPPNLRPQDHIAKTFGLTLSQAKRVQHWLRRLFERNLAHDNVSIVHFSKNKVGVESIVGTVDYATKEIGCAWCGEFAAESGQPLEGGFKLVGLAESSLPYDIRPFGLRPAVMYCGDCFAGNSDWFQCAYDLDPQTVKTPLVG